MPLIMIVRIFYVPNPHFEKEKKIFVRTRSSSVKVHLPISESIILVSCRNPFHILFISFQFKMSPSVHFDSKQKIPKQKIPKQKISLFAQKAYLPKVKR